MKVLAVDIGNTQIKLGLFDKDVLVETMQLLNSDVADLNIYLKHIEATKIIVSSVLKDNAEWLLLFNAYAETILLNHHSKLPFTNSYKTPQTLGMDRVAGIAGAMHFYENKNCLVVDAGTCITYDFVTKSNVYEGGSISPGLQMRLKALNEFTGKLPLLPYEETDDWIGKDTSSAIMTGVYYGMLNEINGFISRYHEAFGNIEVIITGGDASKFVKHIKNNVFAQPNLLLYGLNKILKINV